MSYTVFALKWRPTNFDQIIGQNHIVTTLKNALEKNRVAHAYIFSGPRGVGKTSTARILARALNCKEGPTVNPCGKCPICVDVSLGRSFDVIEIDGASNRGIDEIRVLRENVKFPPAVGKYKIYIIDEVHMLTPEAFNALLKTLEEPPDFVKFIFATTQPHKVLPTILSRCQRLDFRRIPLIEIIAQMEKIVAEEKIGIDKEVLFAIAKASDGSLRDAESLLDQLSSFSKDRISLKDIVSVLGIVEQEALSEITEKIIQKDARGALTLLNTIIDEGKDANLFLSNLIEHFRNLMIAKITNADSKLIDLPQEFCEKLLKQSQHFSLEDIFAIFNHLINAQEMSKRMESFRIPLEITLVKLAHDKRGSAAHHTPHISHATHNHDAKPAQAVAAAPAPVKEEAKPAPFKAEHVSIDKVKASWQSIIDALGRVKMSVATYLNEGGLVSLEDNLLTISFPKNFSLHKESLETRGNREFIEKTMAEILHAHVKVNFILSEEIQEPQDDNPPFIKSALDAFKARVIKEN